MNAQGKLFLVTGIIHIIGSFLPHTQLDDFGSGIAFAVGVGLCIYSFKFTEKSDSM